MVQNIVDEIHKIETYNNSPFPILSVYLQITGNQSLADTFKNLVDTTLPVRQYGQVEDDIDYIDAFLRQFKTSSNAKGLAIFSGGNKMWEVITSPYKLPQEVFFDYTPHLEPILHKLDEYKRYLVVLTDRKRSRFFTLYLGAIEASEEFKDDSVPQKSKGRGMTEQQGKRDRHIQNHLHQHFNLVAQRLTTFVEKKPLAGLVIGGHKESMYVFEKHLPKHLKEKIIGEFVADTDLNQNSVIAKSKDVIEKKSNIPKVTTI